MGKLSFPIKNVYGNSGFQTTRENTVVEPEDQNTLVDDQDLGEKLQVNHDPSLSKNIIVGILAITVIIILFSLG